MRTLEEWKKLPLSWSSISSFEWDKEKWYQRYILGEKDPESAELLFGKQLAQSIEDGTCTIPELNKLQDKKEHKFEVIFAGIALVGYADAFCNKTFTKLDEVKSGKKAWDQKRVDEHGQLTMYALMNYITNKVPPEKLKIRLFWLPTEVNGDFSVSLIKPEKVHIFKTKRTMQDILNFGIYIKRIYGEMCQYVDNKEKNA